MCRISIILGQFILSGSYWFVSSEMGAALSIFACLSYSFKLIELTSAASFSLCSKFWYLGELSGVVEVTKFNYVEEVIRNL